MRRVRIRSVALVLAGATALPSKAPISRGVSSIQRIK